VKSYYKTTLLFSVLALHLNAQQKLPDPCGLFNSGTHVSDCNRATPANMVNDSVFPGSKFLLTKDSLHGYTWIKCRNGDKILIIDCGCSDFTNVFQFTTKRFSADTTNYKYWYPKAAELLHEASAGLYATTPFSFKKGADTLLSFTNAYPDSLKLQRIIYYYKGGPPTDGNTDDYMSMMPHFFISRIQKLGNDEYMVEITFSVSL